MQRVYEKDQLCCSTHADGSALIAGSPDRCNYQGETYAGMRNLAAERDYDRYAGREKQEPFVAVIL